MAEIRAQAGRGRGVFLIIDRVAMFSLLFLGGPLKL